MAAVVLFVVAAMLVVAAIWFAVWFAQRRAEAARSLPPLIYPLTTPPASPLNDNGRVSRNGNGNGNGKTNGNGNGYHPPLRKDVPIPRAVAYEPPRTNHRRGPGAPFAPQHETYEDMETVRFVRTADQALQFLPGRLEVVSGPPSLKEIRFVRVPGEPAHLILGRDGGPSPLFVGLGSATVSRLHARLDYADSRWNVKNLSRTNPVVVNDDELTDADLARPLDDGDRLELGEVVLRFHAH